MNLVNGEFELGEIVEMENEFNLLEFVQSFSKPT